MSAMVTYTDHGLPTPSDAAQPVNPIVEIVSGEFRRNGLRVTQGNGYYGIDVDATTAGGGVHIGGNADASEQRLFAVSNDGDNEGNVLRVQNNGNVGVGTTSPQAKLHVNGDIIADNIAGGDFIFRNEGRSLWRMYEDEDGLYAENLISGKHYRLALEPVEK